MDPINQFRIMKYDPVVGSLRPYPSHAEQYRSMNPEKAWLYDPWTGAPRQANEVKADPLGRNITPPQEPIPV